MATLGSRVSAFFDVDNTIWTEKSVISFYRYYLDCTTSDAAKQWELFTLEVGEKIAANTCRADLNAWFYQTHFKGIDRALLSSLASEWFRAQQQKEGFWIHAVLDRLATHQQQGHHIVLVSGSFWEVLEPLRAHVHATDILCAPLIENDGRYTGQLYDTPMIGAGKAHAVVTYMKSRNIDPRLSYSYGDDTSDIPFLGCVGNPTLVVSRDQQDMCRLADTLGYGKLTY